MLQSRILLYSSEARAKLKKGIDALADMVKVTLGPKGRNVVLERRFGAPLVTKDGVTVAKEIYVKDPVENMGVQLVKEVASKTADVAGDGTTTATVLAQAIVNAGIRNVTAGANPMDLKRGIDYAVKVVVEELGKLSRPVSGKEEITQVGTISANNDSEIGQFISDAMDRVGKEGIITVEDAKGIDTTIDVVEGMQFDRGFLSPYFITSVETMQAVMQDCAILLHDGRINDIQSLIPLLEEVVQKGLGVLIIAEDYDPQVLQALVVNKLKNVIKVCAVKSPGFGDRRRDILEDIAILTGGNVISADVGKKLQTATASDLGVAEKVTVTRESTTIIGGKGDRDSIRARVEQIKNLIDTVSSDYDKEKLQERLAKLVGGIGVLRVGAATETELKEKKARIEDALHATRAAVQEGIVPGGGIAYLNARTALLESNKLSNSDQQLGLQIVYDALAQPFYTIAENAGVNGKVALAEVERSGNGEPSSYFGYNALTNQYCDLVAAGVIDPTKVVRCALENAASIAGLFLTTEGVVAESLEEKEAKEKLLNQEPAF